MVPEVQSPPRAVTQTLKYRCDKLVDGGLLSKRVSSDNELIIYARTPVAEACKHYEAGIPPHPALVVSNLTGETISLGLDVRFFEDLPSVPQNSFATFKKLDGKLVTGFWHNNKMVLTDRDSFNSEVTEEVYKKYYKKFRIFRTGMLKTGIFELVDGSSFIDDSEELYLIGARDKAFRDINPTQLQGNFEVYPIVSQLLFMTKLEDLYLRSSDSKNYTEGYVIRFNDLRGTRVKFQTEWFLNKSYEEDDIDSKLRSAFTFRKDLRRESILASFKPRHHRLVDQKLKELNYTIDKHKTMLGALYSEVYTPDLAKFSKYLEDDCFNDYRFYMFQAYHNLDWTPNLIQDAVKTCLN